MNSFDDAVLSWKRGWRSFVLFETKLNCINGHGSSSELSTSTARNHMRFDLLGEKPPLIMPCSYGISQIGMFGNPQWQLFLPQSSVFLVHINPFLDACRAVDRRSSGRVHETCCRSYLLTGECFSNRVLNLYDELISF